MPDDGVSDDHSVASHLAEMSEAVAGGFLEDWRGGGCRPWPGSLLPLLRDVSGGGTGWHRPPSKCTWPRLVSPQQGLQTDHSITSEVQEQSGCM